MEIVLFCPLFVIIVIFGRGWSATPHTYLCIKCTYRSESPPKIKYIWSTFTTCYVLKISAFCFCCGVYSAGGGCPVNKARLVLFPEGGGLIWEPPVATTDIIVSLDPDQPARATVSREKETNSKSFAHPPPLSVGSSEQCWTATGLNPFPTAIVAKSHWL